MLLLFACSLFLTAQKGTFIAYDIVTEMKSDDIDVADFSNLFFANSSFEIAYNNDITYSKLIFGSFYNQESEFDFKTQTNTVLMSGIMGEKAYRGALDLAAMGDQTPASAITFIKGKKFVAGYKCKQATATDGKGNLITYWYTTKLPKPIGSLNTPKAIPGVCLEISTSLPEQTITYIAKSVDLKIDMASYKLKIPEGITIEPLSAMENYGQ